MLQFYRYFKTQWIESIFSNWQIFQTLAGFTTTNNPVESYNAIIKRFFTNRLKLNLIPALEIFKNECIEPESSREFHYAKTKEVTACLENKAKKLDESKFIKIDKHLYQYNHKNGDISTINLTNEKCTCYETVDKGLCLHLIRVAIIEKHRLPGLKSIDKFSIRLNRRKKQVDIDSSSSFSEIDDDINANDAISPTANKSSGSNSSPLVNTMPMSSSKTSQPEKRRPGRPLRVPAALVTENLVKIIDKKNPLKAIRCSQRILNKSNN